MKTLAENVRAARRYNGWTQEELAERAGVSQTTIDKIEQGRTLKSKFLPNIAVALGVPLEFIDPDLAVVKKEWSERQKDNPENFYDLRMPEYFPLFGIERKDAALEFRLSKEPLSKIPAPRWHIGINVRCLFWDDNSLSPSIDKGDALFFNVDGQIYAGKTGLFISSDSNDRTYMIARLIMADEQDWTVKLLNSDNSFKISTQKWPLCAPLKVRYCYDLGDSVREESWRGGPRTNEAFGGQT